MGIATTLALALGPLAGMWLVVWGGHGWVFGVSAALAVGATLLTLAQSETLREPAAVPLRWASAFSPEVLYPSAVTLGLMVTYGTVSAYLPLRAAAAGQNVGLFFSVMALGIIVTRGTVGGLSDRVGRPPVAAAGAAAVAAAMAVIATGEGPGRLVLGGALYGLGHGVAQPSLMAWCVDRADVRARGRAMGTLYTALELGIAAGSIGAGWVVAWSGYRAVFLLGAGSAAAAALLALARVALDRRGSRLWSRG